MAARPVDAIPTRQDLPAFVGVSDQTAGATGICMNLVENPGGHGSGTAAHVGFETAIYLIEGTVETSYGDQLQHSVTSRAGDFLFIAPGVPHQPRNLSSRRPHDP